MKKLYTMIFVIGFVFQFKFYAQTNYALTFNNGLSQYINVAYTDTLQPKNAITVEAWLNVGSWAGVPGIVGNTEFGGYELQIEQVSGFNRLHFWVFRNGNYADAYINESEFGTGWHHVAGTFDGRYTKIYLDGILMFTNDAGAIYPIHYANHNSLIIGAEASSGSNPYGYYFNGSIDEVRIWNIARPIDSIYAAMHRGLVGNEPGLIGYWNLDEGSGTIINDLTIYNQDGILVNSPSWISTVTPLPVELTSFSANINGSNVSLDWQTATELNSYGFEVERRVSSLQSTVGSKSQNNWVKIGFVQGSGNSNSPKEYSFVEVNPVSRKSYYRLKMIDIDGSFEYSDIVEVSFNLDISTFELSQNYPNPFNPTTSIQYSVGSRQNVILKVFDVLGKEVATLVNETKEAGNYSVQFNATNLSSGVSAKGGYASGVYFYRLQAGGMTKLNKMIFNK